MTFVLSDSVPPSPIRTAESDNPTSGESPSTMGRLNYELTSHDYIAAARKMFIYRVRIILAIFAAVFGFIFAVSIMFVYRGGRNDIIKILIEQSLSFLPIMSMLCGFYAFQYYILIPISTQRSLQGSQILAQPWTCEWTSDGMTLSNARGSMTYIWADFLKVRDSKNAFLLFYSRHGNLIVPKRAFATDADRTAFECLIRQKNIPLHRV